MVPGGHTVSSTAVLPAARFGRHWPYTHRRPRARHRRPAWFRFGDKRGGYGRAVDRSAADVADAIVRTHAHIVPAFTTVVFVADRDTRRIDHEPHVPTPRGGRGGRGRAGLRLGVEELTPRGDVLGQGFSGGIGIARTRS